MLAWAKSQWLVFLDQLTTVKLREFRASWQNSALTTQRKHHRLNGFFNFCIDNDWLTKNPSKRMKGVHASSVPTDYFTLSVEKNVDGTYAYGEWKGGRDFRHRASRLRALILLMRWSGLSILDAVTLERKRLPGLSPVALSPRGSGTGGRYVFVRSRRSGRVASDRLHHR